MMTSDQSEEHLQMFGDVVFHKETLRVRNSVLPQLNDVVRALIRWAHLHVLHVPAHLCLHLTSEMLKENVAAEVGLEAGFRTGLGNGELLLASWTDKDLLQHCGLCRSAHRVRQARLLWNKKAACSLNKPGRNLCPCQAWSWEHVPSDVATLRSWSTCKSWRTSTTGSRSFTSPTFGRLEPKLLTCSWVGHDRSPRPGWSKHWRSWRRKDGRRPRGTHNGGHLNKRWGWLQAGHGNSSRCRGSHRWRRNPSSGSSK